MFRVRRSLDEATTRKHVPINWSTGTSLLSAILLSAMSIVGHGRASPRPHVRLLPGEPTLGWTLLPAIRADMSGKRGTFHFERIKLQANLGSSHRRVGRVLS
jgi:hypothetical protein